MEQVLKMLLVEDDRDAREIMASIIGVRFKDVTLYIAKNGREALELFHEHLPDLVITDINMPELGGLELSQKVREVKPDTIIIVITADTGKAALEDAIGSGFQIDHYIVKPVDFKKLFSAIEQSLLLLE
jgi:CheY-like chemotaxis protein